MPIYVASAPRVGARDSCAQVVLISHQWAGRRHPDPEFAQFAVLQQVTWHDLVLNQES